MAWTGDYLAIVAEIMNEMPMDRIVGPATTRLALYHRITAQTDPKAFDGEYAKIVMHTSWPQNAQPRVERGDVVKPGIDEFKEQHILLAQYMSSIGWTQEEAERAVKTNRAAVLDLVNLKTKNAPIDMRRKMNMAYSGDGTGRLARVASYGGTRTVTVDNDRADFGIQGLQWIRLGDYVDIYTVPDIAGTSAWTTKCTNCKVTEISKSLLTFQITTVTNDSTSVISQSPADGDFVFLANSVTFTSDSKFSSWNGAMGLMGIVDDGSSVGNEFNNGSGNAYNSSWGGATFQNLTRTTYPQLMAKVLRAGDWASGGADGTAATCSLGVVDDCIRYIEERGDGGGTVTAMYMNGSTRAWVAEMAYAAHNAFEAVKEGKIVPGFQLMGYRMGDRVIPVITIDTLPDGQIYMGDENDLVRFEPKPIGWHPNKSGEIIFESPGTRNLTYESWLRTITQRGAYACWNWLRLEDIDVSDYSISALV